VWYSIDSKDYLTGGHMTINLQDFVTGISNIKRDINVLLTWENLYDLTFILSTQFLSPRVKQLFKTQFGAGDYTFIYSSADDPNICQLSLHKDWEYLYFLWVQPKCCYLFHIPKTDIVQLGLSVNHADSQMLELNTLFKHSVRLTNSSANYLSKYLTAILE